MKLRVRKINLKEPITSAKNSVSLIKSLYNKSAFSRENCWAVFLDSGLIPFSVFHASMGGLNKTVFDTKLITRAAIEQSAYAVLILHNHCGHNCQPSKADISETIKLKKAFDVFDIKFLDHIIITQWDCYSFFDEKIIE